MCLPTQKEQKKSTFGPLLYCIDTEDCAFKRISKTLTSSKMAALPSNRLMVDGSGWMFVNIGQVDRVNDR